MSKFKALILGSLLLVPVFVFIFISTFGEHHFGLRTYFPVTTQDGKIKTTAEGDTIFRQVPDFNLITQTNQNLSQNDLTDGVYVASFMYTSCPDICLKTTSQLVRLHEAFADVPGVKFVSFTVDPANDSVPVLKAFADKYGADAKRWFFLTGTAEEINNVATEGFYTSINKLTTGEIIHSEKFFLVDKDKRVRGIYQGTDAKETDRLKLEINVLLDGYSKSK
ncbi:SCO family protein [Pontibacter arcticus]|uniref:SCO family protein n=1 Tax=Pontibacter arcticus TaxID=2080288 RepID=A0A364RGY6_9BACT|nr:SCO family protein [Pontibacter arcticus]RAU83525.1 SCO family protein [Pontibacter arcticus]